MIAPDPFCQYYAPLLENTYDVLDRIVVNAYFALACGGGGFGTGGDNCTTPKRIWTTRT